MYDQLRTIFPGTTKEDAMQTVQLRLPDFVTINPREIQLLVASKYYEQGVLSLGQAAELVGVSKRTFIELLGDYGVSVFNYPAEEIERDFNNA
jgi:predicted HTH domain antitoxin